MVCLTDPGRPGLSNYLRRPHRSYMPCRCTGPSLCCLRHPMKQPACSCRSSSAECKPPPARRGRVRRSTLVQTSARDGPSIAGSVGRCFDQTSRSRRCPTTCRWAFHDLRRSDIAAPTSLWVMTGPVTRPRLSFIIHFKNFHSSTSSPRWNALCASLECHLDRRGFKGRRRHGGPTPRALKIRNPAGAGVSTADRDVVYPGGGDPPSRRPRVITSAVARSFWRPVPPSPLSSPAVDADRVGTRRSIDDVSRACLGTLGDSDRRPSSRVRVPIRAVVPIGWYEAIDRDPPRLHRLAPALLISRAFSVSCPRIVTWTVVARRPLKHLFDPSIARLNVFSSRSRHHSSDHRCPITPTPYPSDLSSTMSRARQLDRSSRLMPPSCACV